MRWHNLWLLVGLLPGVNGCVRHYRAPYPHEPHAVLKIRRVYESSNGPQLRETATINENVAYHGTSSPEQTQEDARVDAILVHPRPAIIQFNSTYFHTELRTVTESYTEQVPYTKTESYSCGDYKSYRTCTRTVTAYRSESRMRTVNRHVEVTDGKCAGAVSFHPQVGHTYLLQYTYQQNEYCSLNCYEQTPLDDGQFEQKPCPEPSPPPR